MKWNIIQHFIETAYELGMPKLKSASYTDAKDFLQSTYFHTKVELLSRTPRRWKASMHLKKKM